MKPFFTFGLGQTICADKFLGIKDILSRLISTHFGTESPLSMFSNNLPIFLLKDKAFVSKFQIFIWDWDLGRKELGIQPSCVHSPCCKLIMNINFLLVERDINEIPI